MDFRAFLYIRLSADWSYNVSPVCVPLAVRFRKSKQWSRKFGRCLQEFGRFSISLSLSCSESTPNISWHDTAFDIAMYWMLIKIQPDATVCRYLFTAKSLYTFRVSQHPSSGVLKIPLTSMYCWALKCVDSMIKCYLTTLPVTNFF